MKDDEIRRINYLKKDDYMDENSIIKKSTHFFIFEEFFNLHIYFSIFGLKH